MPSTYTPIATTTLGSSSSTITFSSISGSYTDLIISCAPIGTGDAQIVMRFNSDTGANYSFTILSGNGTTAESARGAGRTGINLDYYYSVTTSGGMALVNVMNYANTTTNKTAIIRSNNAAQAAMANVGMWRNTSAITSITLDATINSFDTGSTFTLYGVKSA